MKKCKKLLGLILGLALMLFTWTGCSTAATTATTTAATTGTTAASTTGTTPAYNFSEGIDDNGFYKNIKALDSVKLCDYKNISIPGEIHKITAAAIQEETDAILADYSEVKKITDRAIVDGDTVNIDYVGSVGGVEFEGGSTAGAGTDVTIGVTVYIDDFLQQLIGHKPGESFNINVTFPADYGKENLNGKDAVFATKINYISENVLPELTDAFVLNNLSSESGWKTVLEMKAGITSDLQSSAIEKYLQEYIVKNTTINVIPELILKHQENSMIAYFQGYAAYYSVEFQEFLKSYLNVSTVEELLAQHKEDNTNAANYYLILQAIAEDASITVNDEKVAAYFTESVGAEEYLKYKTDYGIPYLKMIVLDRTVMDYLKEHVVLK